MGAYNYAVISLLTEKVADIEPGTPKDGVIRKLSETFNLVRDRSVYSCDEFSFRVCSSKNGSFSNTVLSLSSLIKYDQRPFVVILDSPSGCQMFLANTTFLKKISHSSHELRSDNIKGSFNGSDIMREYEGIVNEPNNFEQLFCIHQAYSLEENIERLVEATNNISPHKTKYDISESARAIILDAPLRALQFMSSEEYDELKQDLIERTERVQDLITIAAFIDNVNLRGRVIEELITSDDPQIIETLRKSLKDGAMLSIKTDQKLGDYSRIFPSFHTETDIKTKVLFLQSAPKAYNVDKLLEFLSQPDSVYLFFLIGIDEDNSIFSRLVSVFQQDLLDITKVQFHWAGRNSRGVTQFEGQALDRIIQSSDYSINVENSVSFLCKLMSL